MCQCNTTATTLYMCTSTCLLFEHCGIHILADQWKRCLLRIKGYQPSLVEYWHQRPYDWHLLYYLHKRMTFMGLSIVTTFAIKILNIIKNLIVLLDKLDIIIQ